MQSCDTLAVCAKNSSNKKNLFGKNSDRPIGEAQPLVFIPREYHAPGSKKKCTYIEIDEVEESYALIGSRPYWIWGFEMGVNEHGLVIGNEAQGSRNAYESKVGLLGMDLLRLGLERAKTAKDAIKVITALLEEYGQDGNASLLFERKYENSYLLMDRDEIWILETAGREWAAKRVSDMAAISNCYTIGEDFDMCSESLVEKAVNSGWISEDEKFNFAKAYTLPAARQAYAVPRYQRMTQLLSEKSLHDFSSLKNIFRDHFENTVMAPRFGATAGTSYSVCMHPQTKNDSKTAASLFVTYDDVLGLSMRHAFATPCVSVYMPIYFTGYLPECMTLGEGMFDEKSMWWQLERVNIAVSMDEARYGESIRAALMQLEENIEKRTASVEAEAKELYNLGKQEEAAEKLNRHMDSSTQEILCLCDRLLSSIDIKFCGPCKELIEWYDNKVKLFPNYSLSPKE